MNRRSARTIPSLLLLAGCAAAAAKAAPAPRVSLALAPTLALAPSETGHVALDTGAVLLIRQLVQSGRVLWADTVKTFAPAAPAPVTAPPVVVTDTAAPHVTIAVSATAIHVGDTVKVTAQCFAKGDTLYTAPGGFYVNPTDTVPFGPFTVRPPIWIVAKRVGTTAVHAVCWPATGTNGVGATSATITVSSAAPVAHITIASSAGHVYAVDDSLVDTMRVMQDSTLQLCALARDAAGNALWNSCQVSPASGRVIGNPTYWRLAMAWLETRRRDAP